MTRISARVATILLCGLVVSCAGYVPGQQSYWDEKVKELCAKDGGVRIFEKVHVSAEDIKLLGMSSGKVSIPVKELASPNAPLYSVEKNTLLGGAGNVHIGRTESSVTRRRDGAVVAQWIAYSRTGGEPPIGLSDGTTFFCPDLKQITSDLQQLFILD